jgi:hypothetical protein
VQKKMLGLPRRSDTRSIFGSGRPFSVHVPVETDIDQFCLLEEIQFHVCNTLFSFSCQLLGSGWAGPLGELGLVGVEDMTVETR